MEWRNLYRGFLMGMSDLIPGVSGGTVAVLLGIYDELLAAIGGVFSREWRRHVNFLLPLGTGMAAALFSLSRAIHWLLTNHLVPTQFFFLGLIAGMVPGLLRRAEAGQRFGHAHRAVLLGGAALVASLAFLPAEHVAPIWLPLTPAVAVGLFSAGALASAAMLLPGISGSFVLLLLGVYPTAIYALSSFHLGLIAIIGAGVITGFVAVSKLIDFLLTHHRDMTFAAIIGLIVGSLAVVFPGWPTGGTLSYVVTATAFVVGFVAAHRFG